MHLQKEAEYSLSLVSLEPTTDEIISKHYCKARFPFNMRISIKVLLIVASSRRHQTKQEVALGYQYVFYRDLGLYVYKLRRDLL